MENTNTKQIVDSSLNIDRPDILKKQWSNTLTFKEIKDALFKFLMQSNIRFSSFEKLTFPITVKSKLDGSTFILNNNTYYTATCRLLDITVDNQPVYIIAIPRNELSLDKRQFGKLLYLKQVHKLILFTQEDCKELGIDISDQSWLQSLNKVILKRWARLLFKKISDLGSNIESKYSLNNIYKYIEGNSSNKVGITLSKITTLKQEGLILKHKLLKTRLDTLLVKDNPPEACLDFLARLDRDSAKYIKEIFQYSDNLFKQIYKQKTIFNDKNYTKIGINTENIIKLLSKSLSQGFSYQVQSETLLKNSIKIQDIKTFQTAYLSLNVTKSNKSRGIHFSTPLLKIFKQNKVSTFHHWDLKFNKITNKLERFRCYLISTEDTLKQNKNNKICIYDSNVSKDYNIYLLD